MKKYLAILGILLAGACSPRIVEVVKTERVDSVVVQIRERVIHDTTTFEIPVEVEKIVTRDTVSHLENTYAKSDAAVVSGFLHHSLESIPQVIYVPVDVAVADTTSSNIHTEIIEHTKTIEKPLSWWQQFRLSTYWIVFLAAIGFGGWTFRKQIVAIIKKII